MILYGTQITEEINAIRRKIDLVQGGRSCAKARMAFAKKFGFGQKIYALTNAILEQIWKASLHDRIFFCSNYSWKWPLSWFDIKDILVSVQIKSEVESAKSTARVVSPSKPLRTQQETIWANSLPLCVKLYSLVKRDRSFQNTKHQQSDSYYSRM